MNNAQLDMVLGYLNEGTEINTIDFVYESINQDIENFSNYIVTESVAEKAKAIFAKIVKFFKDLFEKVKQFVRFIGGKITEFIGKIKAKLAKKKKEKGATNESVLYEAESAKIPYYHCEAMGESVDMEVGAMASIANQFSAEQLYNEFAELSKSLFGDSMSDELFEKSMNEAERLIGELGSVKFEVRFKDTSGDPDEIRLKYCDLLMKDAKILEKSTKDIDGQVGQVRSAMEKSGIKEQNEARFNRFMSYMQKSVGPSAKYVNMMMNVIKKVATSWLLTGVATEG